MVCCGGCARGGHAYTMVVVVGVGMCSYRVHGDDLASTELAQTGSDTQILFDIN